MKFSREEIRELWQQIASLGIRDTDLPDAEEINGEEYVAIVQDKTNKKVLIEDLFGQYMTEEILEHVYHGKSAYEIAVEHGFTGTEQEWLNSLVGEDGAQGATGPQGPQGPKGDSADPYVLPVANSATLGGIKLGFQEAEKNYAVKLNADQRAYVTVPWTGGGGSGDGGYYEQAFKAVSGTSTPSLPSDDATLPSDGWDHYAPTNPTGEYVIWMATRFIDGSGNKNPWQGPWRISGADGENGIDGDKYEYIYARTTDESVSPANPNSGVPATPGKVVTDDDFVPQGWFDNAQGVTASLPVEWMAVRIKTFTAQNPSGSWSNFVGPTLWSKYGYNGTDGDGIEYIYYAGSSYPASEPNNWSTSAEGFQNRGYILPGSGWVQDPVDMSGAGLGPGTKQWVSTRKRYPDTEGAPSLWHAFTEPALWSYYAEDGVDGDAGIGVVADFDNDTMAVSLKSSGLNNAFSQSAVITLYNGAGILSSTVTSIVVTDTAGGTYPTQTWVTNPSGNTINVALPADAINLSSKQLIVTVTVTGTLPDTTSVVRSAAITVIGVHFGTDGVNGEDGVSVQLVLNTPVVRKLKNGTKYPSAIEPMCVWRVGDGSPQQYIPSTISNLPGFSFRYSLDNGTEAALTSDQILTSSFTGNVRVELDYNPGTGNMLVDQETVLVVEDGADGKNVVEIEEWYALSASKTTAPTTGWEKNTFTVPGVISANTPFYIWNYEVTKFDNNTQITSTPTVISILYEGKGVAAITNYYMASANSNPDPSIRGNEITHTVASGWSTSALSAQANMSASVPYLLNFEEIIFSDQSKQWTDIRIIAFYTPTDIEYIKSVFPGHVIDNRNYAMLASFLGVVDSSDSTKIAAMINGSSDVSYDATHGKLIWASGFSSVPSTSGHNLGYDGTFRVYEDGSLYCTQAHVSGEITSGGLSGTIADTYGSIELGLSENGFLVNTEDANHVFYSYFKVNPIGLSTQPASVDAVCEISSGVNGVPALYIDGGQGHAISIPHGDIDITIGGIVVNQGTIVVGSGSITTPSISATNATITNINNTPVSNIGTKKSFGYISSSQTVTDAYNAYYVGGSGATVTLPTSQGYEGFEFKFFAASAFTITSSAYINTFFGGAQAAGTSFSLLAGYMYTAIFDGQDWQVSRSA